MVAGPGDPGPGLKVLQRGAVGPVQDLLEHLLAGGPVRGGLLVPGQASAALVLPDRGVQHRDGLGERNRHVGVDRRLAGGLSGLAFQLGEPLGGGVRLGGRQPGQVIGECRVPAAGPAEPGAGTRVDLLVDRVVRLALDNLTCGEAEGLCSRSPPETRWFSVLGGVDVVAACRPASGLALGLPDVGKVVTLGDGDDHGQPAASSYWVPRHRGADHDHLDQCNGLRGYQPW